MLLTSIWGFLVELATMIDYLRLKSWFMVMKGIGEICTDSYISAIKRFVKTTGLEAITEDDAITYLMTFYRDNKSYSHIVNTSLALERYSDYLGKPFRLGRPRKPKRIIREFLTESEIARMFCFCKNIREKAVLSLLAYSGIRNLELCNLKVGDINFNEETIFVKAGKGKKDGVCCISLACLEVIQEYLRQYPRNKEQSLFFNIAPNATGEKFKTGTVRKIVKTIAYRAGLKRRVWPHLFRHSLALNMLLRGADLYTVKEQLRHSDITTTLVYVYSNTQVMKNRYQVFAPNYIWAATMNQFITHSYYGGR